MASNVIEPRNPRTTPEDGFGDKTPLRINIHRSADDKLPAPLIKGWTVQPTSKEQTIQLGREAWLDLSTKDQQWEKWLAVGAALAVGREEAMFEAGTNKPERAKYNKVFGAWLARQGFDKIDECDRSRLFKCIDNSAAIEKWRATLTTSERLKLNHPSSVLRRWKAKSIVPDPNKSPKLLPVAKLNESIATLSEENHRLKQEIERGGGDLWSPKDRAKDIAKVMVDKLSRSKAEAVARAILKMLHEKAEAAS
jgi:hypothetical protein